MDIDPSEIPKGSDYQWVTKAVCGDESLGLVSNMEKTGWRLVPRTRHPKLQSTDPKWVEFGGLVLMERPQFLTERSKIWESQKADAQIVSACEAMNEIGNAYLTFSRPININATAKRKTTVKEFLVRQWWVLRVWWRNKFIGEIRS